MHIPKKFDVNTHGSLVRFLIKFVKEFNDLVKTVDVLTETIEVQDKHAVLLYEKLEEQAQEIGVVQQHATSLFDKIVALELKVAELAKKESEEKHEKN